MTTYTDHSFANTSLVGARFFQTTFVRCDFRSVDCTDAIFGDARFEECNFEAARLVRASLNTAWFANCNLTAADLTEADLGGARLHEVLLLGATLLGVRAGKIEITRSDASRSVWTGGRMTGGIVSGANLRGAILDDVDLGWCSLSSCDLRDATLSRARLDHTRLEDCQLHDVNGVPREPWDVVVTGSSGLAQQELLARWQALRGEAHASPYPLGPAAHDDGQVLAAILDADAALDDALLPGELVYPILTPWFTRPRLYGMPATNPDRMIFVGLLGDLGGEEDGVLLENRPENLAPVARAAGIQLADEREAAHWAHLAYYLARGAQRGEQWMLEAMEATTDGWRIVAAVRSGDRRSPVSMTVSRSGAVTIDESPR